MKTHGPITGEPWMFMSEDLDPWQLVRPMDGLHPEPPQHIVYRFR